MNKRSGSSDRKSVFMDQMKHEDYLIFVKKRKECNAKAQKIVEKLLDTTTEEMFLQVLKYLNQAYLEDVFEERFILKICGYPLCDNQLGSIPKHKFKISTSVNKVYDITERKKFCSPQCFTAAKYIREQLPSSPLWVLENEEKRCYKLWNHTKSFSSLGDEIQLKYDNINENGIDNHRSNKDTKNTQFTSITNIKHECNTILNLQKAAADDTSVQTEVVESININESETHNLNTTKLTNSNSLPLTSFDKISGSKSRNIIRQKSYTEEIDKNTVHKMTDINVKQQKTLKNIVDTKTIPKVSILKIISNTLCSWITVDTLIYILGEDRVKEYCKENSHQFKSSIDLKLTPKQLEQYAKLCKKLDLMEIQEDLSLITKSENLKPLPDYEYLKQENHKLMIKVRAFYGGKTEISVDELSTDDTTIASSRDRVETVFLPLNDQYDQIVKRRGIVLSYLDPILAKLLLEYNINENISFELQQLINTFELDATNITFKPAMQKLLALFILGLMSLQYNLKEKLNNILSSKLFAQILNAYNVHVNEFINIINDVTDIEKVISARKI